MLRNTGAEQPTVSQLQLTLVGCGVVLFFPFLHDELPPGVGENAMAALVYMAGARETIPSLEQRTKKSHGSLTRGIKLALHAINHTYLLRENDTAEFR